MASELLKKIFWYVCLAVVLVLLGWGMTVLTDRIDYKWYWNRVPHHFLFYGTIDQYAADNGVASIEKLNDVMSEVKLTYDNGKTELLEVETKSLLISSGARVSLLGA